MRLLVASQLWDLPLVRTPKLDSAEYLSWARRLAAGDFTWPIVSPHGPGYPFFLAALLAIGSGSLKFAIACQAVLGAVTATLVSLIARRWFDDRAALIGGLAYALYAPVVFVETSILSEGLLLFLLVAALWAALKGCATTSPTSARVKGRATTGRGAGLQACLAGVCLGLATLVRPTAIVFAIALAIARRRHVVPLALAFAIVVAPALIVNWSISHSLSIQGYGGVNVYIGDSPLHDGRATFRLGRGWDALNAEAARAGITDPSQQDRFYIAKTLTEIGHHPLAFVRLVASKALWLVQSEEVRDSHSFYFFADQSWLLRILPRWAMLFPLACIGLWTAVSRRLEAIDLFAFAIAGVVTTVFLVVGTRYRMPLVPVMAVLAGAGVDALLARRQLSTVIPIGVAAVVVSYVLHDPRNTNVAEEWAFTGSALVSEHDLPAATTAYQQALQLDPQSSLAWDGLGLAQYDAGTLTDARQSLSRALAIDRDNGRAEYHAGLVDEREQKFADAVGHYRRAADLSPYDAEVLQRLATVLGMSGRSADARIAMQRSLDLDPMNGEAWLDLCLLQLDLGDRQAASVSFQRAAELRANPQKLAFASRALTASGK